MIVEASQTVIINCNSRYLWCIKENLSRLLICFAFEFIPEADPRTLPELSRQDLRKKYGKPVHPLEHGFQRLVDCADASLAEIWRLQKNQELFPDIETALGFLGEISAYVSELRDIIQVRLKRYSGREAFLQDAETELNEILLPGKDDKRTMWQQLLHGDAPGASLKDVHKTAYTISQVLPRPAQIYLDGLMQEQKAVQAKLGLVSPIQLWAGRLMADTILLRLIRHMRKPQ